MLLWLGVLFLLFLFFSWTISVEKSNVCILGGVRGLVLQKVGVCFEATPPPKAAHRTAFPLALSYDGRS